MEKLNFETFKEKWLEQETESCDDKEQLDFEISESSDWSEIFQVIRMWSSKPLQERVVNFLERNNSFLDDEGKKIFETF